MCNALNRLTVFWIAAIIVFCTVAAYAEARSTPVEVKNSPLVRIDESGNRVVAFQNEPWSVSQSGAWSVGITNTPNVSVTNTPSVSVSNSPTVKIDGTTNTVKASQNGAWNVGVTGTAAVTQSGTWNVGVSGTPNVNVANIPSVSVSNTPNVSVSNSPVVKIDNIQNVVSTPTRGAGFLLFTENQVIPIGGSIISPTFNCTGFKELRFLIESNWGASTLYTSVEFQSPLGSGYWSGVYTHYMTISPAAFSAPVYGAYGRIRVTNNVGSPVTIYSQSWVYMVN